MGRKLISGLAALVMAAAGLVITSAEPASASIDQCTSGNWCYWSSPDWMGTYYGFTGGGNTGTITLRGYFNNGATGRGVKWYSGSNYVGTYYGCTSQFYGHQNIPSRIARSHKWNPTANGQCTGSW